MRRLAVGLSVLVYVGLANTGLAQKSDPISGEWFVTRTIFGIPQYQRFTIKLENGKVNGAFGNGRKIDGTFDGKTLHFIAKNDDSTIECTATLKGDTLSGKFVETPTDDPKDVWDNPITATRASAVISAPKRHEFKPSIFYREFSATPPPVLRISPGDTVHTTTVDAGGADENGITRSLGGNPQTGPFYIEGAWPGDTLAN